MRKPRLPVGFLLSTLAFACSDSTGVQPEDLAGTWSATKMEFTNTANTSQKVDAIQLGVSFTMTINSDGTVSSVFTMGGSTDTDTGSISVTGNAVTLNLDGPATGTLERNGDTLTVNLTTGVEWDFDDDGTDEDVTLLLVLTKVS